MDKGLDLKKKKRQKESGPERPKARVYPGDGHSLNMQDGVMGDKEGEAGAGRGGGHAPQINSQCIGAGRAKEGTRDTDTV